MIVQFCVCRTASSAVWLGLRGSGVEKMRTELRQNCLSLSADVDWDDGQVRFYVTNMCMCTKSSTVFAYIHYPTKCLDSHCTPLIHRKQSLANDYCEPSVCRILIVSLCAGAQCCEGCWTLWSSPSSPPLLPPPKSHLCVNKVVELTNRSSLDPLPPHWRRGWLTTGERGPESVSCKSRRQTLTGKNSCRTHFECQSHNNVSVV